MINVENYMLQSVYADFRLMIHFMYAFINILSFRIIRQIVEITGTNM